MIGGAHIAAALLTGALLGCGAASAAVRIEGRVDAGGGAVERSTVTLWAATAGEPRRLVQTRTNREGRFELRAEENPRRDIVFYLVAEGGEPTVNRSAGDNKALALMAVVGSEPPERVTINEMTTVASVWTSAQFLQGTELKGHALGLRIAAGNVHNFVDLATGGWGEAIQGPLNSGQTPTLANFATLADLLAGCATRVKADACNQLFAAATDPNGKVPTDMLAAAQSIARNPWYQPERLYTLLDQFIRSRRGRTCAPSRSCRT